VCVYRFPEWRRRSRRTPRALTNKPALSNCREASGLAVRGSCPFARAGCDVCDCAGRSAWPLVPTAADPAVDVRVRAVVVVGGAA
jgi:hypothetical protein